MDTFDQDLVERYLRNECSKEEAKKVVAWFKTHEGQAYLKLNLDKHLNRADESGYFLLDHEIQSEEIFQKISASKGRKAQNYRSPAAIRWWKAAGSVAAMIILTAAYLFLFRQETQKLVEVYTPYGTTQTVQLPDGSTVTLNANSRLVYAALNQEHGDREVWLDGEGFFSVTHTVDDQRFIVHADQVDVEVLGTEFNVKNRRSKTQIVLTSGKVKLTANNLETVPHLPSESDKDVSGYQVEPEKMLIMQPGELAEFSDETRAFETKKVNPEKYSDWIDNEWVFDQSPLKDAIRVLEDFYGYTIELEDPALEDSIFTAKISSDEVDLFLKIIAESFELKVNKQRDVITLTK